MKIQILLTILLISGFVQGQNISSFDLTLGLNYSYRSLQNSDGGNANQLIIDSREVESKKLNWRFGFNLSKQISPSFLLSAGVALNTVGLKGEKMTDIRWPSEHDGNGGYQFDPTLPHEIQFVYEYWFIEFPFKGRFELKSNILIPFLEIGFSPAVFSTLRTIQITDIGNESDFNGNQSANFNSFQVVGIISFGVNYDINLSYQIFINPVFRYHLNSLSSSPIKEHLYNYGINFGMRRKINNNTQNKM